MANETIKDGNITIERYKISRDGFDLNFLQSVRKSLDRDLVTQTLKFFRVGTQAAMRTRFCLS